MANDSVGASVDASAAGTGDDGPGDRVLGRILERTGEYATPRSTVVEVVGDDVDECHLAGGHGARLVEDDRVDGRVDSSTSGPLIRMPSWAPRPVPTISAVGVARPSAHGQAMINTATAAVNA